MEDVRKVNSIQLYLMWKNLTVGLAFIVGLIALNNMLPFYLGPAVALGFAAIMYTMLYNNRAQGEKSCMVVIYALFFCMISYSFVVITLNLLYAWGFYLLPNELILFSKYYVPTLVITPVSAVTLWVVYLRRNKLRLCISCKMDHGARQERGATGIVLSHESSLQLRNLALILTVVSVIIWGYYLRYFVQIDQNSRDRYVFMWLLIIVSVLDEVYFAFRYYNLYLDLKEADEIITPEELSDMTVKTYARFYVFCGEHIYVQRHSVDPLMPYREVIDTPFVNKRSLTGLTVEDMRRNIERLTGEKDGELKFFYGRKTPGSEKNNLLRYFYFLDGTIEDHQEMNVDGEWIEFSELKKIYSKTPGKMATLAVSDMTRLATIILTEKLFDEKGFRKNKIMNYIPNFTVNDIKKSDLDFQDDKWIQISMFNSDLPMYRLRRWWRKLSGVSNNTRQWG